MRTVLDCARALPFDRGLTVADSALREGGVSLWRVREEADELRGPGSAKARRVAAQASYVSANPLESVLRAIVLDVPGFAFHGGRQEFHRDCRRYDELVAREWTVFRFTWEHVMFDPGFVVWTLESWLRSRRGQQVRPAPSRVA